MGATGPRAAWAALGILLAGCTAVVEGGAESVSVDTGQFGEIAPGTRGWLGWLKANEHCAAYGRRPQLAELSGSIARYRCVKGD
jgi:hypothetical protein